jgi:thymidylate synthase
MGGQLIFTNAVEAISYFGHMLKYFGQKETTEKWQGIENKVEMWEINNQHLSFMMPQHIEVMQMQTKCSIPWAEDHFIERVSRQPLNPGNEYKNWPYYKNVAWNDKQFRNQDEKFTHTYMERYWPKYAPQGSGHVANPGIRYDYGDLDDVVNLLLKEPHTRQAYLPVWFPEDTGSVHGGRVPCSIGYHILIRNRQLSIHYLIRACDYIRHLRNDVYLTMRLAYWIKDELMRRGEYKFSELSLGTMTMDIINLHVFYNERSLIV